MKLGILPGKLAICRLGARGDIPAWASGTWFLSITRTRDELSIVCDQQYVPSETLASREWRAFRLEGPIDLGETGVLAALAVPLAEARIPIFPVATHDTDYTLVRENDLPRALEALRAAGHEVEEVPPA